MRPARRLIIVEIRNNDTPFLFENLSRDNVAHGKSENVHMTFNELSEFYSKSKFVLDVFAGAMGVVDK